VARRSLRARDSGDARRRAPDWALLSRATDSVVTYVVDLYLNQRLSTYQIEQTTGIGRQRVTRMLHRAGVPVAPQGRGRPKPSKFAERPPEQLLRTLYVQLELDTPSIGRLLGISDRQIRSQLARYGIARRNRGGWDRRDRTDVDRGDLETLYVQKELSADAVGAQLGVSRRIVLRSAHSQRLTVRIGGTGNEPTNEVLLETLYSDGWVRATLRKHQVSIVPESGPIWQRFRVPVPLTTELVKDLYVACGLSAFQIELLTGQPTTTILRRLARAGVYRRPRGGLSPFLLRQRRGLP
jgi:hypothetical protein